MAYESLDGMKQFSGVSRRGFLKSALVSAGLVSLAQYEAVAQMVGGPSARSVRGRGHCLTPARIGSGPQAARARWSCHAGCRGRGSGPELSF